MMQTGFMPHHLGPPPRRQQPPPLQQGQMLPMSFGPGSNLMMQHGGFQPPPGQQDATPAGMASGMIQPPPHTSHGMLAPAPTMIAKGGAPNTNFPPRQQSQTMHNANGLPGLPPTSFQGVLNMNNAGASLQVAPTPSQTQQLLVPGAHQSSGKVLQQQQQPSLWTSQQNQHLTWQPQQQQQVTNAAQAPPPPPELWQSQNQQQPKLLSHRASWSGDTQFDALAPQPLVPFADRTNSPPTKDLGKQKKGKKGVRFNDSPPEDITATEFQTEAIAQSIAGVSLYGSLDRVYTDKQLGSSLYASADALLESRAIVGQENDPDLSISTKPLYPFNLTPLTTLAMDQTSLRDNNVKSSSSIMMSSSGSFGSSASATPLPLQNMANMDRTVMRSEADKIAERLMHTEMELERLRRQGQLIGESMRKHKLTVYESPTKRIGSDNQAAPVQQSTMPAMLARPMPSAQPTTPTKPPKLGTFGAESPGGSIMSAPLRSASSDVPPAPSLMPQHAAQQAAAAQQSAAMQQSVYAPQVPAVNLPLLQPVLPQPATPQSCMSPATSVHAPSSLTSTQLGPPPMLMPLHNTASHPPLLQPYQPSLASAAAASAATAVPTATDVIPAISAAAIPAPAVDPAPVAAIPAINPLPAAAAAIAATSSIQKLPTTTADVAPPAHVTLSSIPPVGDVTLSSIPPVGDVTLSSIPPVGDVTLSSIPPVGHVTLSAVPLVGGFTSVGCSADAAACAEPAADDKLMPMPCNMLASSPATVWFDPSSCSHMKIITDPKLISEQLAQSNNAKVPHVPQASVSNGDALMAPTMVPSMVPLEATRLAAAAHASPLHHSLCVQAAPPTAPNVPRSSGTTVLIPPIDSLSDDQLARHFEALNLTREHATLADVVRAYKRFSQRLLDTPHDLEAFTVSFKLCEAAVGGGSATNVKGKLDAITEEEEGQSDSPLKEAAQVVLECDPLEVYHQVIHTGRKHPDLKVELGASIEDFVLGHVATFQFDRMICVDMSGQTQPESCELQVKIMPGMRAGTQFIFECEGDESLGMIPSDVCVTLVLEPHSRFVCAGDDLATEVHVTLADAVGGSPISVLSVQNQRLLLQAPQGTVLGPGHVFKCDSEGLPLAHDPSQRGSLFVKVHVHFPQSLPLTVDQLAALHKLLAQEPVLLPPSPHDAAQQAEHVVNGSLVRAHEADFGRDDPDDSPMLCAQQ